MEPLMIGLTVALVIATAALAKLVIRLAPRA